MTISTDELTLFADDARGPARRGAWRASVYRALRRELQRRRLNWTAQRSAVVDYLIAARTHVGLEEIYRVLRRSHGIGRSTVFRTINLLEQCGLVNRVSGGDELGRYELQVDRPHHDHLVCVACGAIREFQSAPMERYQDQAVEREGFEMLWHRHEIFGRCPQCRSTVARRKRAGA